MFWRAARGRVGPNSRAGLHMAIFLLNPYGLYACILIPKWLASLPEMSRLASSSEMSGFTRSPEKLACRSLRSVRCPRRGRICQSVLDFQSVYAGWKRGTSSSRHHMALHPTFLILASLASNLGPEQSVLYQEGKEVGCGHLTYIKKYDIIFKKRVCVRRWRLGHLTILKKYDIINKKTSTADRHQCDRIWLDFYNFLWYNESRWWCANRCAVYMPRTWFLSKILI